MANRKRWLFGIGSVSGSVATNCPSWQEISLIYDRQWVWALRTCFIKSANPKASTKELKRLLTSVRMSLACFSVNRYPLWARMLRRAVRWSGNIVPFVPRRCLSWLRCFPASGCRCVLHTTCPRHRFLLSRVDDVRVAALSVPHRERNGTDRPGEEDCQKVGRL